MTFLACWALGPLLGAGLAAHEAEHHGQGHVGSVGAHETILPAPHGHCHERGTSPHRHEVVPPAATLPMVSGTKRLAAVADTSEGALRGTGLSIRPPDPELAAPGSGPATPGLSPLQDLCVLRL